MIKKRLAKTQKNKVAKFLLYLSLIIAIFFVAVGVTKDLIGVQCRGFLKVDTTCADPFAWFDYGSTSYGWLIFMILVAAFVVSLTVFLTNHMLPNETTHSKNTRRSS